MNVIKPICLVIAAYSPHNRHTTAVSGRVGSLLLSARALTVTVAWRFSCVQTRNYYKKVSIYVDTSMGIDWIFN